jgi:autotransporter-associated beta strand protein
LTGQEAIGNSLRSYFQLRHNGYRRPQIERLESRWAPATHTWTGATSNFWSEDRNWNGGSPAGDPNAALIFPDGSLQLFGNSNDLNNLTIQSITISGAYSITGNGLTLNGGGITLEGTSTSGPTEIDLPIRLAASQTWNVTAQSELGVGGVITGVEGAGLTKDGMGTLTLTGDNTYTGVTTVAAGMLLVGGSQAGSDVIVNSGAALGGSGTVGAITTRGMIRPSEFGLGILHSGNVTFNAGSFLDVVLGVTNLNVTLPKLTQLSVTGTVNLSGSPMLTLNLSSTPTVGETLTPITSTGAVTGTFTRLPESSTLTALEFGTPSGWMFRVNYQTNNVVLTALPPNQSYVTRLYLDLLQREPDAGGLTFWTGLLDQNMATRSQVASAFVNSPEYRMQEVNEVYRNFLHRDSDPSGLSGWTQFLVQGHTLEQLEVQIVASSEYLLRRAGANPSNFLAIVIGDAFQRSITQADRSLFGDDSGSNGGRRELAENVFATNEYRQDLVQSYYQRYLQRNVDPGGLTLSLAALDNGLRDEVLITAIVGSPEYLARAPSLRIIRL